MTAVSMIEVGTLPAVRLEARDGAVATMTLYGAHMVSWRDAKGVERLFCSAKSALDGSKPIRGGVPIIFPQFAERGTGMRHGFARVSTWRHTDSGVDGARAWAEFELTEADLAAPLAAAWPHRFALTLRVAVGGDSLETTFNVRNAGDDAFAFSAALHSYFAVDDVAALRVEGVQDEPLAIGDKIDHIFFNVGPSIDVVTPEAELNVTQTGFADAVVWNPGAVDAAALSDMADGEYQRFVCVESAKIEAVTLPAGAAWRGRQRIAVA